MKYPVYSVRDCKVGFGQPIIALNEQSMVRQFGFDINRPDSMYLYAAKDYDLYKIGTYDTDSGSFDSIIPEFVRSAVDLVGDFK